MFELKPIVSQALADGLLERLPHAAIFYDLAHVAERLEALNQSFPSGTLHALAIKACPITSLMRFASEMGFGAEAASASELQQALRAGINADRIVFDSPAKTTEELRFALSAGVVINADNLQELTRLSVLVPEVNGTRRSIGVRLNPEVGAGSIEATSTAMRGSKFGVSLSEHRVELLAAFERWPWLTGVHVHVGSQGCSQQLMVESLSRVLEFIEDVERHCGRNRIQMVDIGGGLSVSYHLDEPSPEFVDYARALEHRCPRLFAGDFQLVTEFGRAIWANTAVAISRVEYTKVSGGRNIATVHLGADMFPRTAYVPHVWRHEVSVLDRSGRSKGGAMVEQDIAGPLCFSGDLLARGRMLPLIEPGDYVVIHDVGAYTLSMWSHYNSRLSPAAYGISRQEDLSLLRASETVADAVRFWD